MKLTITELDHITDNLARRNEDLLSLLRSCIRERELLKEKNEVLIAKLNEIKVHGLQ